MWETQLPTLLFSCEVFFLIFCCYVVIPKLFLSPLPTKRGTSLLALGAKLKGTPLDSRDPFAPPIPLFSPIVCIKKDNLIEQGFRP